METNNRNYKNPTVIAWEQLRQLLTQFADRMQNFDAMAQKQGRDIGVDEVFNEIQNIRKQLDEIQKGLNLQNNTINTERVVDKSQPETPFSITNNNRNDESKNMNKKLIRLTESDLHRIVKESVQKILSEAFEQNQELEENQEAAYQGSYPGMDNGHGSFEMNHPEGKYSLYFDKAQRDAHNYNAQQRGQTPNPYAGWSKRVNDGKGNWNDAEFNSDDMHMYNDDDASQTAANLRKFDPNGAYHWDMFRGRGDKFRQ